MIFSLRGQQKPLFENDQGMHADLMKGNSDSKVGNRVNHFAGSIEVSTTGVDFDADGCPFREGICHIDIATVKTEFDHPGTDTGAGGCVKHLGGGHERESGSSSAFFSHIFTCREIGLSQLVLRQPRRKRPRVDALT